MQQENPAEPVCTKKWMKVLDNTSIIVSCKANLSMLDQRIAMIFTLNTDCLPEGMSIPGLLVLIKSGASNKINVLVVNETSYDIQLDKNIRLGNVEIIKSVTHLQVKKVSAINGHESVKLEPIYNTKSAEAVTPMEEIPSEEKDQIQSQGTTLGDYNSDSSLINHQLKVLEKFDLFLNTVQIHFFCVHNPF